MLASKYRFHRRNQVNKVYRDGKALRGGPISLKYTSSGGSRKQFAVVVSKKVSKSAVTRNRIRRRLFEAIRLNIDEAPEGASVIVGAFDAKLVDMPSDELNRRVRELLSKVRA